MTLCYTISQSLRTLHFVVRFDFNMYVDADRPRCITVVKMIGASNEKAFLVDSHTNSSIGDQGCVAALEEKFSGSVFQGIDVASKSKSTVY